MAGRGTALGRRTVRDPGGGLGHPGGGAWRTRPTLADQRITGLTWPEVAYQVTVRIPAGTVLWEEVAFRGVLQATLRRVLPRPAALAVTSGVFGLWHVRPTVEALRINQCGGQPAGRRGVRRGQRRGHGRRLLAAVLAARTVWQPGCAGPAASVRELRRGAGRPRRARNIRHPKVVARSST